MKPSHNKQPVLVFGATGRQGGAVAAALRQAGWPVRALVRDPAAPKVTALREVGVELVQGILADAGAIRAAMQGVHGVFSVLPGNLADGEEVRFGSCIADLAVECGVAHFVYSSGASAGDKLTGVARFDAKPLIEAHLRTLPLAATVVRPMIFMEMLTQPGYGLDQGKFTFFLRPEQSMQLVAVADIGKIVAAIFADQTRFKGQTLKLASDTVTGQELGTIFTEATDRPIVYEQFLPEVLAANPDLRHIAESLEAGPLAEHIDLSVMRALDPELLSLRAWLAGEGRGAFEKALQGKR